MVSGKKWYALRTANGKEVKIKNAIIAELSRLGLSNSLEDILIPMEKVTQIKNEKKVVKEVVTLPGYLYLKVDLSGEVGHTIKSITGVLGFVSAVRGGEPMPVKEFEISRMISKEDEKVNNVEQVELLFAKGDDVKVLDGSFADFEGKIEEIFPEKRTLTVSIKVFGKETPIELGYEQIEKI